MIIEILLFALKLTLPVISFGVAYLAITKGDEKKLHDSEKENWWEQFTVVGRWLLLAALSTLIVSLSIGGITGVRQLHEDRERKNAQIIAETNLRLALMEMIAPFQEAILQAQCPPDPYWELNVGFEITPFDPFDKNIRNILGVVDLSQNVAENRGTWGEVVEEHFRRGVIKINAVRAIAPLRANIQMLVTKLSGDELLMQLMDHESVIAAYGLMLEDQFAPNDRRWEIYTPFWETIEELDRSLIIDEEMLEAQGRQHPFDLAQILDDADGLIPETDCELILPSHQ